MGVYTYTLRKTGSVEVLGLGRVYMLRYLCRANDLDEPWFDDSGFRGRLRGRLTAAVNRAKDAFSGPVLFVYDACNVGPDRGAEVYRTDDADKVSVWYDCDILAGESMGRLKPIKVGRKTVWTLMTREEQKAWEAEAKAREYAMEEEGRRRYREMQEQRERERLAREAQRQRDDSFNSSGL